MCEREVTTPLTLLTATAGDTIAAADTWQTASKYIRKESHPRSFFYVEYTPGAGEEAADTAELNIQVLFAVDQVDVNATVDSIAWKPYTIEADRSTPPAGVVEKQPAVKRWTIGTADDTDPGSTATPEALRTFSFEITLPARALTLEFYETGHDGGFTAGNVKAWCAHGNW